MVLVIAKAAYLELCGGKNLYKLAVPVSQLEFSSTLDLLLNYESSHLRRPALRRSEADQVYLLSPLLLPHLRLHLPRLRSPDLGRRPAERAWVP